MADAPEKNAENEATTGSQTGGMKTFLILLLVLDVLAAGVYGWLALIQKSKVGTEFASANRNLTRVKDNSESLASAVDRIGRENQQKVAVLSDLVNKVAERIPLERGGTMKELIETSPGRRNRFAKYKAWDEVTTEVRFLHKEGYGFKDLVSFMQKIEASNSKVQIKSINFGNRDDGEETWRPLSMTVRVFTPTEKK